MHQRSAFALTLTQYNVLLFIIYCFVDKHREVVDFDEFMKTKRKSPGGKKRERGEDDGLTGEPDPLKGLFFERIVDRGILFHH